MLPVYRCYPSLPGLEACLQRIIAPIVHEIPSSCLSQHYRHYATTTPYSGTKGVGADAGAFPGSSLPRIMPRILHHRTKQEMIAAVTIPEPDPHGPMRVIEQQQASTSSSSIEYDDVSLMCQLASQGQLDARRAELVRLLRRHNYSLPCLVGQTIRAQVLRVGRDSVFVDPGFYGIRWGPCGAPCNDTIHH